MPHNHTDWVLSLFCSCIRLLLTRANCGISNPRFLISLQAVKYQLTDFDETYLHNFQTCFHSIGFGAYQTLVWNSNFIQFYWHKLGLSQPNATYLKCNEVLLCVHCNYQGITGSDRKLKSKQWLNCMQCDPIGCFLTFLGEKFSCKVSQILDDFCAIFKNISFKITTPVDYYFGNFWKNWAAFIPTSDHTACVPQL